MVREKKTFSKPAMSYFKGIHYTLNVYYNQDALTILIIYQLLLPRLVCVIKNLKEIQYCKIFNLVNTYKSDLFWNRMW